MFRRAAAIALLAWMLGFAWFAIWLPQPQGGGKTDAVVVLTGAEGRIPRGIEALNKGWTTRMFVSGVDREVKPPEFEEIQKVPHRLMECCITLGFDSTDTRSNAREVARWVAANKVQSVRMVTTDWHMRRAVFEFGRMSPPGVTVIEDAVASQPSLETLFIEYHKLLARFVSALWD